MGFSRFACCFRGQLAFRCVHSEICPKQAEPYLTRAKSVDLDGREFKTLIWPFSPESILETLEAETPRFKCWPLFRQLIRVACLFIPTFFFLGGREGHGGGMGGGEKVLLRNYLFTVGE